MYARKASAGNARISKMSKVFLDTNNFVYSLDQSDSGKRKKCRNLIKSLIDENNGVISTQVMQEFYVATTAKLFAAFASKTH
jgi:predicted nucleic acid-binding protein